MAGPRITREQIAKVAQLARLALTEAETERLVVDLGSVLDHVASLEGVDTRDVPPATEVRLGRAPLRADEVRPGLPRDDALANAPAVEDGAFVVPRILGGGGGKAGGT